MESWNVSGEPVSDLEKKHRMFFAKYEICTLLFALPLNSYVYNVSSQTLLPKASLIPRAI